MIDFVFAQFERNCIRQSRAGAQNSIELGPALSRVPELVLANWLEAFHQSGLSAGIRTV